MKNIIKIILLIICAYQLNAGEIKLFKSIEVNGASPATNDKFAWQVAVGEDFVYLSSPNDSSVNKSSGAVYIYRNDGQGLVNGKFPVGTVVVKHSKNTAGTVNEFTAMVKRGNNFSPKAGDWEWFMLSPDGKIMTGENNMKMRGANLMDGMCAGCHAGAAAKDYVFSKK